MNPLKRTFTDEDYEGDGSEVRRSKGRSLAWSVDTVTVSLHVRTYTVVTSCRGTILSRHQFVTCSSDGPFLYRDQPRLIKDSEHSYVGRGLGRWYRFWFSQSLGGIRTCRLTFSIQRVTESQKTRQKRNQVKNGVKFSFYHFPG